MTTVGMIGLGQIGAAMTARLLKTGVPVVGYDTNAERTVEVGSVGMVIADSPADVAHRTDGPLLINVQTLGQTYQVLDGEGGIAEHITGRDVVTTGTFGEMPVRNLAVAVAEHGGELLDAPHTGSYPAIETGTLTFFLGGSPRVREAAMFAIEKIGRNIHVIGDEPGQGQIMKLVNAIGLAFNAMSVVEMERIAVASGVDPEQALRWIDECSGSSWLSVRMPDIAQTLLEHNVDNLEKDLRAVLEPGAPTAGSLPVTAAILDSFRSSWLNRPL